MTSSGINLGPLPQSDRNAELQRASVAALNALLRTFTKLILRDERYEDYGVDVSLEVNLERHPTNLRAQVQLEAMETASPNKDGSISLSVKVANLNYLLNGTCPIYVMHDSRANELWYTWAVDQRHRLDAENKQWLQQDEVTLRFERRLDQAALIAVHDRILRDGKFQRQLQDFLARCPKGDSLRVAIDPATLDTTDSNLALETLSKCGLTLVSNGFADKVLQLAGVLDTKARANPKIQLACAYAAFVKGRYLTTLGNLAEASQHDTSLSRSERLFVRRLRDACQYHTGTISKDKYVELQGNRSREAVGAQQLGLLIEEMRHRHLAERNLTKRAELLSKLRDLVETMRKQGDADDVVQLHADIHLIYAEGSDSHLGMMHQISLLAINGKLNMGGLAERREAVRKAILEMRYWRASMRSLIERAGRLQMPLLLADAFRASVSVEVAQLGTEILTSEYLGLAAAPDQTSFEALIAAAEKAIVLYERADNIHGQLFSRLLTADIYELRNDDASAKRVAEEVLPIAESFGLQDIISHAMAFETGLTPYGQLRKDVSRATRDQDVSMAEMTDDEVNDHVTSFAESLNLPNERLARVKADYQSTRLIAKERLDYCGHLQVLQNLLHTRDRSTAHASDLMYICHCQLHKHESAFESSEVGSQVAQFKAAFCEHCVDRKPKRS